MKVEVLYFASLADRVGASSEWVEVEPRMDVAGLWSLLVARHEGLRDVPIRPLAACDREYAAWDRGLDGVREVAFLPPVSGG